MKPVEFISRYSLEESVERLRNASEPVSFFPKATQTMMGRVSAPKVNLFRHIPMVRNSFKPFFMGQFQQVDDKIILTGQFGMHWAVKLFLCIWFSMLIVAIIMVAQSPTVAEKPSFFLISGGLLCFGLLLVTGCKYFARNDPAWLAERIQAALE